MICKNCGKQIKDGVSFCPHCGKPVGSSNKKPNKSIFVIMGLVITVIIMTVIIKSGIVSSYFEKKEIQKIEKENREVVDEALMKASEKTTALSVTISGGSSADANYDGYNMESTMNDNAKVDFNNNKVHMSDGNTNFKAMPKVFDGTGHSEGNKFEVYISDSGKVIRSIDGAEFETIEAEPLEIQECLWFFEDIKKNLDNVDIEQDADELILKGTLDNGKEICDTYIKFIDLAGDEPEYQVTDHVSYELRILKTTKEVEHIEFDVSDIAEYVWYGSNDDGLGISNVYGDLRITYRSFQEAEDFEVPILEEDSFSNGITETDLPEWLNAYIERFENEKTDYHKSASLIYLNDDDIPECVLWFYEDDSFYHSYGYILSYNDGLIENELYIAQYGLDGFHYAPQSGLFYTTNWVNGFGEENYIKKLTDSIEDIGNAFDYGAAMEPTYTVNGESVRSSEAVQEYLNSLGLNTTVTDSELYDTVINAYNAFNKKESTTDSSSTKQASSQNNGQDQDYILPDCDSRYYSQEELEALSAEQLKLARNEIYARHGYIFQTGNTKNYFDSKTWYRGTVTEVTDDMLNEYEIANRDLIISIEKK